MSQPPPPQSWHPDLTVRPHLAGMPPYTPIEPYEVLSARLGRPAKSLLKLDANENPYGPPPGVRAALANLEYTHIYPDPESRALRRALADFTSVPADSLLAGAGADELIDLVMRVTLEPGDGVLTCPPTFGMYAFDTRLNAGQVIEAPRRSDFSLDLPAIRQAVTRFHPKLLFIASPNNPDGSLPAPEEIEALLELPVLVVLDEAYIEFTGGGDLSQMDSWMATAPQRENLIVLRTFSKWAGLAGLRLGYGAFPEWILPHLWKAKQPYNVNVAASAAALAALADLQAIQPHLAALCAERDRLAGLLAAECGLEVYPSRANFLLARARQKSGQAIQRWLAQNAGVLVRYFHTPALHDHVRITVGRPEDTPRLLAALQACLRSV